MYTKAFKTAEGRKQVLQYYDMLLQEMKVSYEQLNINTRYGNTYVLAAGEKSAPPLILLHGSAMNSSMWIHDIETYQRSYRVYAPELPGEPGRSDERQLPLDTPGYAFWLADVFNALLIDNKAVVIGASLGAWLAAKFSIMHPEQVARLVLLCPAGIGPQNHKFKSIAMSLLAKGEQGLDELFTKINGDAPIPEIMLNYQKLIALVFNSRQEPIPVFTDEELKSLTMPSTLYVGDKDIMLDSAETAARYRNLLPHAKIITLPGKGHSLTGLAGDIMAMLKCEKSGPAAI